MANHKSKTLLYNIVIIILIIVVVEVGLHLIVGIKGLVKPKKYENPLSLFYNDSELAKKLYAETLYPIDHNDYNPFLGWNVGPYQGQYVTTDLQSGRKTWNPGATQGQEPPAIFFLGGSAAWGFGVRDDYTIPSDFARLLQEQGYTYKVFNYGEPGYTFKQGVMHLTLLLREGRRPNYVIFYDGFNDIYAAHQQGYAGTTHNLFMIEERMRLRYREAIWRGMKEAIKKYSMIYKAINRLLHITKDNRYQEVATHYNDDQLQSLSRDIIADYKKSLDLLDHLSKVYGFHYICFWQPTIFTEQNIMDVELIIKDPRQDDLTFKKLCNYSHEIIEKAPMDHFYSLTDVLHGRTQPVYIDIAHISEYGTEIVARKIYQIFAQDFLSQGAHPPNK